MYRIVMMCALLPAAVCLAARAQSLKAGFARADITPEKGVLMPGYFKVREVKGVLDPLEANVLALSDGERTAFVVSLDCVDMPDAFADEARDAIAAKTGVPREAIIVHATHTHTSGDLRRTANRLLSAERGAEKMRLSEEYAKKCVAAVAGAAARAVADLKPARLSCGRSVARRVSFGRRYRMKDGTVRTNPGVGNPDIAGPAGTPPDDQVQLLRIDREGAGPIAVLNFQTHPDVIGGELVSADWPGFARRTLEASLGGKAKCLLVNGTEGDVNHVCVDPTPEERAGLHPDFDGVDRGIAHSERMGKAIAHAALSVWEKCAPLVAGRIRFGTETVRVPSNRPKPEEMDEARRIDTLHRAGRDAELPYKGMDLTTKVAAAERKIRLEHGPDHFDLPLSAIAVGNAVAFGGFPGEPFNDIGKAVKAKSPFDLTILACLANGDRGYFPFSDSYAEGGYEAESSPFGPSVADDLIAGQLRLLDGVGGKRIEDFHRSDSLLNVDPMIGTEGVGSEYGGMQPYTCVPFGSFHAVPMTRTNAIGRLSFNSADKTLLGIILTRQPAIWMGDWGEVRIPVKPSRIEAINARPYLTRVTAEGRAFEFTATAHAAWIRGLDSETVAAFPESGINADRMDAKYGYPLPGFGGRWYAEKPHPGELKIGLSLISVEQAKVNLAKEIGERSFDEVVTTTKAKWEELFARVEIDAPDDVKKIFYTGLYHTLLYPRQMDEDGRYYSAFDDKIHSGTRYNCFSLWDTYRAEHPWLTLVAPERVDGMMQSLVDMYKEGGRLPKWPNPSYTGIMVGAPAEVVLQEAMAKGFVGFDHERAKEAIRKNATVPQEHDAERRWEDRGFFGRAPETRAGLTSYLKRGYVACDKTAESVSRTQDFSLADRNRNYTNLWCAAEGMFLPRRGDGSFVSRKELRSPYHDYCEQQPETGVWAVPHDPEGLAELMGGKTEAIRRLDEFFDTIFFRPDGRGNGSIHGNETSHHCAYLYNRFGAPEKTQRRVRQILTKCYSTNRKGFDGNEDCGQMSAWYIFSALGFYPLDPASGEYEIGSPIVRAATLKIGTSTLRIVVNNYAPDCSRVKQVRFNGVVCANWRLRHRDLARGGELVFEMIEPNDI